jgi:hypothetical protein
MYVGELTTLRETDIMTVEIKPPDSWFRRWILNTQGDKFRNL